MSGRWREQADLILADVDASLPPDAGLHTRHQACLRAKPHEFASTSWGTKVWAEAQREYLMRYGYVPKTKPKAAGLPLSPLERQRKAGAA